MLKYIYLITWIFTESIQTTPYLMMREGGNCLLSLSPLCPTALAAFCSEVSIEKGEGKLITRFHGSAAYMDI